MHSEIKIKIFNDSGCIMGPGIIKLLEETEISGSVTAAAKKMELSTTKAWKMIRITEKTNNQKLIITKSGGIGGGSTVLTEYAKQIIKIFHEIEDASYDAVNRTLQTLLNSIPCK